MIPVSRKGALAIGMILWSCGGGAQPSPTVDPAIVARAAVAARAAAATPSPTPQPTHPYQVAFRADQVIIPAEEVPLAGYVLRDERVLPPYGWERRFYAGAGDTAFWWLIVEVQVYSAASRAQTELERIGCTATFSSTLAFRGEIRAEVVGDGAKACFYDYSENIGDWVYYTTRTRNVLVTVKVEGRFTNTQAEIAAQAVSLARHQLAIVDRVSPP